MSRIQAGEMRLLRTIKGKTRRYGVRNEEIRRGVMKESFKERVEKVRLRVFDT